MNPASGRVNVRGTVFDSLTRTPLSGARVTFTAADAAGGTVARATTDSAGAFAVLLRSGAWTSAIEHPRFDSLRVTVPVRRFEVPRKAELTLALATQSPGTITRALCGPLVRDDDVVVVGFVRNAATHNGIDSVSVFVKWVNVTLTPRGFVRSVVGQATSTAADGWYVICGVPAEGTLLSWAQRKGALTGAVLVTLSKAPARLDLTLDTTARLSKGSVDLDPDSSGMNLFPTGVGTARYRVLVRDLGGRPVADARVRILGRSTVRSDAAGAVTLDSIASGTQTLEVLSIGYLPERRVVNVAVGPEPTDTVVVTSLRSVLGAVRITAGRDPIGFELRKGAGVGQFITAEDIVRENPVRTTLLLRTRDGLRYTFDRNGFPSIEVTTLTSACRPLVLIDGFPPDLAPAVPGRAVLDWLIHPDEIGGVEIYATWAQVPPEIAKLAVAPPCAAIVFWTRQLLGLPKADSKQP